MGLVQGEGLEPPTSGMYYRCSIQLSYPRKSSPASLHITWRYTIFVEIPQGTHHLVFFRPKTPLAIWPRTYEQRPSTTHWNIQVMPLICFGIPPRSGFNIETSIWSDVGVMPLENKGHKITSVIVKESLVVRTNPVVDSNGKAEK